jgi:cytochrome c553
MRHLALIALLPLVLVGCADEKKPQTAQPDANAGKALAKAHCAGCHGLDGRGTAPGIPHLAAQVEEYLFESLIAYREGRRTHAALQDMTKHLTTKEIHDVVAFYSNLAPVERRDDKRAVTKSPYERGKALSAKCSRCHGEDGNATEPGMPSLAGQQPHYFVSSLMAYLHGHRNIETMEKELRGLNRIDMENLAVYYASQKPVRRGKPEVGDPVAGEPLTARCGGCHGAGGVSHDTATPTLAGQDAQYLVSAIKAYRDQTRVHDIMLDDNTDQEIADIAAYYATRESKAAESGPITVQELSAKCDRCHAPGIENPSMAIPKIHGQDRDYLIRALRAYHDGKRGSSLMHNMSLPYTEAIIESVASLYANQAAR